LLLAMIRRVLVTRERGAEVDATWQVSGP